MDADSTQRKTKRRAEDEDGDEEMGDDAEVVDVDFDFFDPSEIDYHSINVLLRQLFSTDHSVLDLPGLTDLIVSQTEVGTTVKCDGKDSDPYAFCSVLNLGLHRDNPPVKALLEYLLSKSSSTPSSSTASPDLTAILSSLINDPQPSQNIGIVLCERLVNMPPQIVPPMLRMLDEELGWATEENQPFAFTHLIFLSRVFVPSASDLAENPNLDLSALPTDGVSKKSKKAKKNKGDVASSGTPGAGGDDVQEGLLWPYHPEDEVIEKFSAQVQHFSFTNSTRTKPSKEESDGFEFGVETRGRLMLVPYAVHQPAAGGEDAKGTLNTLAKQMEDWMVAQQAAANASS